MTRDFNEQDKKKKKARIQLPENPANLPQETLGRLEAAVTASLREGYLPCPAAWRIAKDFDIPRMPSGAVMDKRAYPHGCQDLFSKVKSPLWRRCPAATLAGTGRRAEGTGWGRKPDLCGALRPGPSPRYHPALGVGGGQYPEAEDPQLSARLLLKPFRAACLRGKAFRPSPRGALLFTPILPSSSPRCRPAPCRSA